MVWVISIQKGSAQWEQMYSPDEWKIASACEKRKRVSYRRKGLGNIEFFAPRLWQSNSLADLMSN